MVHDSECRLRVQCVQVNVPSESMLSLHFRLQTTPQHSGVAHSGKHRDKVLKCVRPFYAAYVFSHLRATAATRRARKLITERSNTIVSGLVNKLPPRSSLLREPKESHTKQLSVGIDLRQFIRV